jgi:hypothetical protein
VEDGERVDMKIIATVKEDMFLVSISRNEIANFKGDYSGCSKKYEVGDVFEISNMYKNAVDTLASYKELKGNIEKMQKEMTRLLTLMKGETE